MKYQIFTTLYVTASISDAFAPFKLAPRPAVSRMNLMMESTDLFLSAADAVAVVVDGEKDYGDVTKTVLISLVLGGGLIPALISANSAMFRTLSGKGNEDEDAEALKKIQPGESFDPTLLETKFRKYVADSGASGPEIPFSGLLFAADRIPLADIVAILGRIKDIDTIADWKNLPSTKLPNVSLKSPPMWLPRKAFKVNIRKAKFLGWPTDPKTGKPVGGEELKAAEASRISKQGAAISDAALDAVFDSWAWGASVATPDKVGNTLRIIKPSPTEVDIGSFIGAALRGRSATGIAALTFIAIQLTCFGALFLGPGMKLFFDIDTGLGK
jgi:hypothetical protein